jgi:hypothetical protein
MKAHSPGRFLRRRRLFKLAALATSALLLALTLACAAAEQPQETAPQTSQASQLSPAQPAQQPQAAAENAPAQPGSQEITPGMAEADQPATSESASQQSKPAISQEMSSEHPSGSEPMAEAKTDLMDPYKLDAPAKYVGSQPAPEPASGTMEPLASHQNNLADQTSETDAPAAMETDPEPTAAPQAPEAPVAVDALPDVGNQVGNRIPDFTLDLVGGPTVSSVSLVEEGKATFLFFTSTT